MPPSSSDDAVRRATAATAGPVAGPVVPATLSGAARRLMIWEIISVFAVSLGSNTLHAVVSFIGSVTERQALSDQHAVLNFSQAPGARGSICPSSWSASPAPRAR